jgi:hypothetical protein
MAVLCLHALLKCLKNERATISKSGILQTIFTQTLSLNDPKIAIQTLNIVKLVLEIQNGNELKQIVWFIEVVVHQFDDEQIQVLAFQMLYDIFLNAHFNCQLLFTNNSKLFRRIMELF